MASELRTVSTALNGRKQVISRHVKITSRVHNRLRWNGATPPPGGDRPWPRGQRRDRLCRRLSHLVRNKCADACCNWELPADAPTIISTQGPTESCPAHADPAGTDQDSTSASCMEAQGPGGPAAFCCAVTAPHQVSCSELLHLPPSLPPSVGFFSLKLRPQGCPESPLQTPGQEVPVRQAPPSCSAPPAWKADSPVLKPHVQHEHLTARLSSADEAWKVQPDVPASRSETDAAAACDGRRTDFHSAAGNRTASFAPSRLPREQAPPNRDTGA